MQKFVNTKYYKGGFYMDDLTILNELHKGVTTGMSSLEEISKKTKNISTLSASLIIFENNSSLIVRGKVSYHYPGRSE